MDLRTASLLCVFCLPEAALAADPQSAPLAQAGEEPDEVIVTGRRVRFELRLQMEAAERVVYNLFNEFNDEQRFEISCAMHAITGTTRKNQVCQPEFERVALAQEGQDYLAAYRAFMEPGCGDGCAAPEPYTSAMPAATTIARQQRELQRKMQEVAKEHPEFVEALVRFVDVKVSYDRSRGTSNDNDEAP